ncbi:MAG: ATP-binding protein [Lachnospiraceae bacterium]|nr:ATP-binding protein [Lachnospiraceae bacterium]
MKDNPYSLMFGKAPGQMISRMALSEEIYDAFLSETPSVMIYMLMGVRGSGKTVMMTELSEKLGSYKDWITVELNPSRDLLVGLASKLYNEKGLSRIFDKAKINLSFFGIGVEMEGTQKIYDIEVAIDHMLRALKKNGKKVLVTIDEVVNSSEMRIFASAYQIFIRDDLPLFLIMTGLYENIYALQDEKNLTFLYRAPKIKLGSLDMGSIAAHYRKVFDIDEDTSREMAKLTKGYPFAFQVLGYYTYEHGGDYKKAIFDFRQRLNEYVYDKIWSELSANDKKVANAIAMSKTGRIAEIREILGMDSNGFAPYRERLIKKGIVNGTDRGYIRFELPLFDEYVKDNYI